MADFTASDIYKEFIKLLDLCECTDACNHNFSDHNNVDDITKIMKLRYLYNHIAYCHDYNNFTIFFDSQSTGIVSESLNDIARYLEKYNNYNITHTNDSVCITGLSSNKIKTTTVYSYDGLKNLIEEINNVIKKYSDFNFERVCQISEVKNTVDDFATSDIYKEFIKLIKFENYANDYSFSKYKDDIIKIMELRNLFDSVIYDHNYKCFYISFDPDYDYITYSSLNEFATYLNMYNNYNIIHTFDGIYITGIKYNEIKHINIDLDDIIGCMNCEIEKYPEYDFRRIWPTNDIKIALK